jgi:hypothetical protein
MFSCKVAVESRFGRKRKEASPMMVASRAGERRLPTKDVEHCKVHGGAPVPPELLDMPLECRECGARMPASAALAREGSDYMWNYCGSECLAAWCRRKRA